MDRIIAVRKNEKVRGGLAPVVDRIRMGKDGK